MLYRLCSALSRRAGVLEISVIIIIWVLMQSRCFCRCQRVVTQPKPWCSCWCEHFVTQPRCACRCQRVVTQPKPWCSCWCEHFMTQPRYTCRCQRVVTQPKPRRRKGSKVEYPEQFESPALSRRHCQVHARQPMSCKPLLAYRCKARPA